MQTQIIPDFTVDRAYLLNTRLGVNRKYPYPPHRL
jgi:hypothetical protein